VQRMDQPSAKPRGKALLFAAAFYIVAGLYLLVLTLGANADLWVLSVLSIASILAGAGLFMLKRWGFWFAIAVFPLLVVVAASTLSTSMSLPVESADAVAVLFNVSMGIVVLLSFVSVIIVLDNRSRFEKRASEPSQAEAKRG